MPGIGSIDTAVAQGPNSLPIPAFDMTASEAVAVGSSSGVSAAITNTAVCVVSTTDCWIKQGSGTPVAAAATAGNIFLPRGVHFFLKNVSGQKIAVIRDSSDGTLMIYPLKQAA